MLGILIPTKNHSDFVIRQLHYFAYVGCPYTLYVGDSSDKNHADRILKKIDELKGKLSVVYRWIDSDLSGHAVLKELLDIVEEKYVTYLGDDDLCVPSGLSDYVEFLECNPDYATAQGDAVVFELDREGAFGEIAKLGQWLVKECELEAGADRLNFLLNDYWVLDFSVHRTATYREICDCRDVKSSRYISDGPFTEILVGCLAVIRGKSKKMNKLSLFRQWGEHRYRSSKPSQQDWLDQQDWEASFNIFCDTVTEALFSECGMDKLAASELLQAAFSTYLANSFAAEPKLTSLRNMSNSLRETLYRSSVARFAYDQARRVNPGFYSELRLERLLSPESPHHEDFMPIYSTITSKGVS